MKPAVLCVALEELLRVSHISPEVPGLALSNLLDVNPAKAQFLNREIVDTKDENSLDKTIAKAYPQLLGYISFINTTGQVLTYSRGKTAGESGLHDLRSIGVGGHTDLEDVVTQNGNINVAATLARSIERELKEELGLSASIDIKQDEFLICDLSDPVSAVHVGLWDVFQVSENLLHPTEELNDVQWLSLDELMVNIDSYEPWSQLAIRHLVSRMPTTVSEQEAVEA